MAALSFDLCPPLPAEEGPSLQHYTMQPEMGFHSAQARQGIETWRGRYAWRSAPYGDIWYVRHLWELSGDGALPMDFSFATDGVQREVLFAREPRVTEESAFGGRLEVELVEAL